MKKEWLLLVIAPILLAFIWILTGFYFWVYKTSLAVSWCELQKDLIAPSPIITDSSYNNKTKELQLTIQNPGGMPILLLDKTLVLKPANKTPVILMTSIPLWITVPPYSEITFNLKLGNNWKNFKVGDVLDTTISYSLPVSNDIYTVSNIFKRSNKENTNWLIENALWNNKEKYSSYKKSNK